VDGAEIIVASDVTNPLFGPHGAAVVYGPQKGATSAEIEESDRMLRALANRMGKEREANVSGAGAAGGLGFGMMVYFGATLRPGVEIVMNAVNLRQRLQGADWCITGEGKIDSSTLAGKVAAGVASVCRQMGVRCIAIGGVVERTDGMENLFDRIAEIKQPGMSPEYAIANAAELLEKQCRMIRF
jgi:glycerate kinase